MAEEANSEMSTVIDRVLEFIQRKGRATICEIAVALALNQSQVERMAAMLEESGVITVRYALIDSGKTELIAKETKDSGAIDRLKRDEERMTELSSVITNDLEKLESSCTTVEHDISRWIVEASETLTSMEARKDGNGGTSTALTQADELEKMAKTFEVKIKEAREKMTGETQNMNSRFSNFYSKLKEFKANAYKTPYAKGGAGGPGGSSIGKIRKIFGGSK
jgi:DNA-binding Lrp family transcriptional regulator